MSGTVNRREFMKALGVGATLAPVSMAGALVGDKRPPAGKPNIIIVMADQQLVRARSNYLGMLRLIDDQVQRLVQTLREKGRYDNTILIFLADHGDFFGEYGLVRKGPELPECLTRIPFFSWVPASRPVPSPIRRTSPSSILCRPCARPSDSRFPPACRDAACGRC